MTSPKPKADRSRVVVAVDAEPPEHTGTGDMWPLTWAHDDNLYAAAGDNSGIPSTTFTPMNLFVVRGSPAVPGEKVHIEEVHHLPVDPKLYCRGTLVDADYGVKPAGLLSLDGVLYLSVQNINYGDNPDFNRQHNLNGWIIVSRDCGKTWDTDASFQTFFTGRTASAHFVQFGRDYAGARDEFVYAYFPCGLDGQSYWCNNDCIVMGRVPRDQFLDRRAWEFLCDFDGAGTPRWNSDDSLAIPVFNYPGFTGENHVSYNAGLRRYIMGNYAFYDDHGRPRPYHQLPLRQYKSQLTLYEASEPWGPWRLFWHVDEWGQGNYQPVFPTKWMSADGCDMTMVCSGNGPYYSFTTQRLHLKIG
jgi:hypothetical protein